MKQINGVWFPDRDVQAMSGKLPRMAKNGFHLSHLAAALQHVTNWTIAIDGGANVGFWAKEMSTHFEKVYAFELDPNTFACLEKNIGDIENVNITNKGLSNTHTYVGIANGRTSNSLGRYINGTGNIETVTIDSLNLMDLGFLKLDVEGHEGKVLNGARTTLEKYKPIVVIEHKPNKPFLAKRSGSCDPIKILNELGATLIDKVGKNNIDWVFGW